MTYCHSVVSADNSKPTRSTDFFCTQEGPERRERRAGKFYFNVTWRTRISWEKNSHWLELIKPTYWEAERCVSFVFHSDVAEFGAPKCGVGSYSLLCYRVCLCAFHRHRILRLLALHFFKHQTIPKNLNLGKLIKKANRTYMKFLEMSTVGGCLTHAMI